MTSRPDAPRLDLLSFNQMTADRHSLRDVAEACARHGIGWISVWRHKIAEAGGIDAAVRQVRDAGLRVSSVCRGGMFPALTQAERDARIEDNRRAIDEAAALGAEVLVLVCGAAADKDIAGARRMVADGIAAVMSHAAERGVKLGIEPLHPAFAAERSCITTLREARTLAERLDPSGATVGVVTDVYHLWWDPELHEELAATGRRILGYHVNDWLVPQTNVLKGRGMMGDGVIDLRPIRATVERAGWAGPIEVEIFNDDVWAMPIDELLPLVKARFVEHV